MGFYIRKGFNFGPLRLNLSRSGLGASFGVKGARIGIGPRGRYIHMGRGGLYYRQTLHTESEPSHPGIELPPQVVPSDNLQEITSLAATGMVDSSAAQLLHELNRIKRQKDLFPIVLSVGVVLFLRVLLLGVAWWVWSIEALATMVLAVWARNCDVTTGTAILNYSFEGDTGLSFSKLRNAFQQTMHCQGFWHVDAAGATSDWKRNAGVNSLERRSDSHPGFSRPPKVECNIDVPTLKARRRVLYFFPDRLLVYDSAGVGAVPYGELQAQMTHTRFVEDGTVPADAQQLGSTWRYVNRNGGPDRRFNNNRELPILLYGEISLRSSSGLNELFQCSVPDAAVELTSTIAGCGADLRENAFTADNVAEPKSDPPSHNEGRITRPVLWAAVILMLGLVFFLPWPSVNLFTNPVLQTDVELQHAKEEQARQLFVRGLAQNLLSRQTNVTVSSVADTLIFHFSKEGPKAARRDGVEPFNKQILIKKFLQPNTERELCGLSFRHLRIARNDAPPNAYELDCVDPLPITNSTKM